MLPDLTLLRGEYLLSCTSDFRLLFVFFKRESESTVYMAVLFLVLALCVWLLVDEIISNFLLPCDQMLGLAPRNGSSDDSEAT